MNGTTPAATARVAAIALLALVAPIALACDRPPPPLDAAGHDAPIDPRLLCTGLGVPQASPGDPVAGHTYAGWALPDFFAPYCTGCHTRDLTDPLARNGAPLDVDLDDEASVRAALPRIRDAVAAPAYMPPGEPRPTCAERAALLAWIDAGAP